MYKYAIVYHEYKGKKYSNFVLDLITEDLRIVTYSTIWWNDSDNVFYDDGFLAENCNYHSEVIILEILGNKYDI